jgi:hypothetical protein
VYATLGLCCLVAILLATTGDEPVLGDPGDFERLERAPFGAPRYRGNLASTQLDEVSGMAASRLQDDLLWLVNDRGSGPILHAIGADGRDRGSVRIEGAKNTDWEDIASFAWEEEAGGRTRAYLLVADVGDNGARRKKLSLYAVEEPVLRGAAFPEGAVVPLAWRQKFRFDDGPRDAEGIAVDIAGRRVLILTKRKVPAEAYSLPLPMPTSAKPADDETAVAARIALLGTIPQPTKADLEEDPRYGEYRSQATGFDIAPDGRGAVVLTYKHAYYYSRAVGESWEKALVRQPQLLALPPMEQAEAAAFSRSGESLFVTSEERPAPLFEIPRD